MRFNGYGTKRTSDSLRVVSSKIHQAAVAHLPPCHHMRNLAEFVTEPLVKWMSPAKRHCVHSDVPARSEEGEIVHEQGRRGRSARILS